MDSRVKKEESSVKGPDIRQGLGYSGNSGSIMTQTKTKKF